MQSDVAELALVDQRQRFGHAVDEGLAADEAGARMVLGLHREMLAAAEPDLQADVVCAAEQRAQVARRRHRNVEREPRQQGVEQRGLARAQRVTLAPAEEGALAIQGLFHRQAPSCPVPAMNGMNR